MLGPMASLERFHHVALTVSDLDRSVEWYRRILGFVELFREEGPERRACVLGFAGGGHSVGLVQHSASDGTPFSPIRTGLDHLAFSVDSLEAMHEWADRLASAGVQHSGVIDIPPGAILNVTDPDGIALALFWDRAAP